MTRFQDFARSESGAVTVDWVVMTAAVAGLGLAVTVVVSGGLEDLSSDIDDHLTAIDISAIHAWGAGALAALWGEVTPVSEKNGFTAQDAEARVLAEIAAHGGDVQAAYNALYAMALFEANNPAHNWGNEIDAIGAFEAYVLENGIALETGENLSYGELHQIYSESPEQLGTQR